MSGPKGIDDLFFSGGNPRLRHRHRIAPEVSKPKFPYELPERAPVRGGRLLHEARAEVEAAIDRFAEQAPRWSGRALPVVADPGTGKTTAAAVAVKRHGVNAGFVFGTNALADEFAETNNIRRVEARNPTNCARFELVEALGEQGFPVGKLACGTEEKPICPIRGDCRYFAQLREPGTGVATTEQIFNPLFLNGLDLLVIDDANLERALIRQREVSLNALQKAVLQLAGKWREPARNLCIFLAEALVEAPREFISGPSFWDYLAAVAARRGYNLVGMIETLPKAGTLLAPFDQDGELTLESVLAVPPLNLAYVLAALSEELPMFLSGEDFNSRLRLKASKIEVAHLREHPRDKDGYHISRSSMLILDATPIGPLLSLLTRHHALQPVVGGSVLIPRNVRVIQHARASNGHASIKSPTNIQAVKAEIALERQRFPVAPDHEALIVFKESRPAFADMGFLPENVLHFGSARGTNNLARVTRLHVVGRPFTAPGDIWYLAQVIHHDEEYVAQDMVVRPAEYAGQAYGVDVPDFVDARMAALLRAFRENELWQVVHRARPTLAGEDGRGELVIVIHTTQPIPGLPVSEVVASTAARTVNQDRSDRAELAIRRATAELDAAGEVLSQRAIARKAEVSRNTVARRAAERPSIPPVSQPQEPTEQHGKVAQAHIKEGSMGMSQVPMSSPPRGALCRGGCGTQMPEGQSCSPCAERAVEEWRRRRGRGVG